MFYIISIGISLFFIIKLKMILKNKDKRIKKYISDNYILKKEREKDKQILLKMENKISNKSLEFSHLKNEFFIKQMENEEMKKNIKDINLLNKKLSRANNTNKNLRLKNKELKKEIEK